MPSEPRLLALRDDLVSTLAAMSRAEGCWYDYGVVVSGAAADWEAEKDYQQPRRFLMWDGEVEQDPRHGGEAIAGGAPNRFRHYERFIVSLAIKDGDPEKAAWRMRSDHHKALIGSNRHRSGTRVNTFDVGTLWEPFYEGGAPIGGVLALVYVVRWDHVTGDMTTQ